MAPEQGGSKRALAEARDGVGQSAVCGAPSDPLDETRESAKRAVCRGEDFWCYLPKRAGLSKVTRPSPKGGRNPVEGSALTSFKLKAKPSACRQTGEPKRLAPLTLTLSPKGRGDQTEKCRGFGRPQKNRSLGCNASQLSLTGIVFTRFSRRILLWFGFDAPWVTSFSAGG